VTSQPAGPKESGLYYYGARYYAAWLCRFTAVDPRAASFPYQSSFVYAANNPTTLTDVNGEYAGGPNDPEDPVQGTVLPVDQTTGNPVATLEPITVTETLTPEEWYGVKLNIGKQLHASPDAFGKAYGSAKTKEQKELLYQSYIAYGNQGGAKVLGAALAIPTAFVAAPLIAETAVDMLVEAALGFDPIISPFDLVEKTAKKKVVGELAENVTEKNVREGVTQTTAKNIYKFEERGYSYKLDASIAKDGTKDFTHYLDKDGESIVVGISSISKDGELSNVFSVPEELQGHGVSKAIYKQLADEGFSSVSSLYPARGLNTNYRAFMEAYDPTKNNFVEAAMSTPASKALGSGWQPINIQIKEGKSISMQWIRRR